MKSDKFIRRMNTSDEQGQEPSGGMVPLNQAREIWDTNASFWDDYMGEGNDFQRLLIGPTTERLLELRGGETVLDIACGNGPVRCGGVHHGVGCKPSAGYGRN